MLYPKPLLSLVFLLSLTLAQAQNKADFLKEPYRPQIHFSPPAHWMNDPNGMVYYKGVYHLFYQYYPADTKWGPMHWGHATSKDLMHWQHRPIALYPDSLGYIFSGSVVVDKNNSSGLGSKGKVPLVAIFTHHDPKGEKAGRNDFQNQSIAYSLDEGKSWTKYAGNPVLKNPGIKDFRDPKVSWYEAGKKWIMTLATLDRISFYSSKDLVHWTKESEFGKQAGAHGGVWECPDLFSLNYKGQKIWVLIVNLNPGGPNGGSATQYFTGRFDGRQFTPFDTNTRWLDYGPDEYAGVTWSNTGDRKIFLGWMSNWLYGQSVPTETWRSAMTIPRELHLEKKGEEYLVCSLPVKELSNINRGVKSMQSFAAAGNQRVFNNISAPLQWKLSLEEARTFSLTLSNSKGENLVIGYDQQSNNYFIDRTHSGRADFYQPFAARHQAPRLSKEKNMELTLVVDVASVELFADNGLSVMTEIFFPTQPYTKMTLDSPGKIKIQSMQYTKLKSIWGK